MASNEKDRFTPEHKEEGSEQFAEIRDKNRERLQEDLERRAERSKGENVEVAKQEAIKEAIERNNQVEASTHETSPAERQINKPSPKVLEANFQKTMQEVRSEMSAPSRTFSKVIHNKTIEKVSDAAGKSVARPNAILSGAVFAFILTLGVYLLAKNFGYPLSGFETIGAFLLGWTLGLVFDFLKIMITGRK